MTILGSVTVVGKADMRDIEKGFKAAAERTKRFGKSLQKVAGVATAATAGLGTLFAGFQQFAQSERAQQRFAERLGLTTSMLRGYQKAARRLNIEQDVMNDALLELSKRSSEALTGTGSMYDALQILNIEVKEFSKLGLAEQFTAVADATRDLDESQRNFLEDEIFGGAADEISGLVGEIDRLGTAFGNVNETAADQSTRDFIREWTDLAELLRDTGRGLVISVGPTAIEAIKGVRTILDAVGWTQEDTALTRARAANQARMSPQSRAASQVPTTFVGHLYEEQQKMVNYLGEIAAAVTDPTDTH